MSLITSFIGLAYEGISSFLHNKWQKALQKAVHAIENRVDLQHNKMFHLEDSMFMHGVYNSNTLEDLIDTVHKLHNRTTWNEKLFSGQINNWYKYYSSSKGIQHSAINSLLFLATVREKYVKMYKRFLNQLRQYSQAIRVFSKGYLPITLLSPSNLNVNSTKGKGNCTETIQKLWPVNKKTVFVLWYEISYIWNRWYEKFNSSVPSVCTSLQPTTSHIVSIRNSSNTYYR